MGERLSQRVRAIPPSQTLALSARAAALRAEGKDVISFAAGEPDFTSPQVALDGATAAVERGDTHYPPVPGTKALKSAIAARLQRDYGVEAPLGQILVSNGAKHSLYNLIQAVVDPGDEVVYSSPYWVSYPAMVTLAGGRGVPVPTRASEGFRLMPEAVEAALSPRTKVLILNSPSNPTGALLEQEDLEAIVKLALDREILIIADEIYGGLVFGGAKHHSALQVQDERLLDHLVLVDGVSKVYAMTGWRIGYCFGPTAVIKAASKIQSQSTSGACAIAQAAAAAALEGGAEAAETMRQAFEVRNKVATEALEAIPGVNVPKAMGAFYLFPDFSAYYGSKVGETLIEGSPSLSELLLDEALVAAVPGAAFGADAHLRFSYALSEDQIRTGLGRVRELLARAEPQPKA